MYTGLVLDSVPEGETCVGAAGTEPASRPATIVLALLQALVPAEFEALTNQLYAVSAASVPDGVMAQVPAPEPHPSCAAL